MSTVNVVLPTAAIGVRYNEAISLTGTGPFELGKYDLPAGLAAKIIGNQLIINGTVTEAYINFEAVFEILTNCPACTATIIVGAMGGSEGTTSCGCVEVSIPPMDLPGAIYGEEYYALIPLGGSGPFEMCGGSVPYCLKAEIVGRMVRISGQVKVRQTPLEVRFSIKNSCTCDCVDFIASISVTGQPGCTYCYTMQPTIAPVGTKVRTSVRLPEGCDPDAQLVLDAFDSNGTTRYMLPGITPPVPLSIYLPQGDSEYTIQDTDVNQHVIFKPRTTQTACLAGCTPCVPYVERFVPNFKDPCAIFWSIKTKRFTAESPSLQEYSAFNIPKGCSVVFDWYDGNTLIQAGILVLSDVHPVSNPGYLTFPAFSAGLDYNFRPQLPLSGSCATRTCFVKPDRIDFDVVAPPLCAINWSLSNKSFRAGQPGDQTLSATGLPANCGIKFQLYNGNVLEPYGEISTLTALNPSVTNLALRFSKVAVGADYNYRPVMPLIGSCTPCSITPARIDFDVSGFVTQWDLFPSPVVEGKASSLRVLSGPPNCSMAFQAYQADGTTIIPGALIKIKTDANGVGESAKGICTSAGTAVWKPASPQPDVCSVNTDFGVASFTHVCTPLSAVPTSCAVNWSMMTTAFIAGVPAQQKFTATGLVPGSTLTLTFFDNGVAQVGGAVVLNYTTPSVTIGSLLTFSSGSIGSNYEYRAVLTGATCALAPTATPFRVLASATGACAGVLTASAGTCG